MRPRWLPAILLCIGGSVLAAEPAGHWPQWRGPGGRGVAPDAAYPTDWAPDRNVAWKAAVPGRGHSSPVVWGDRVFLTTSIEGEHDFTAFAAADDADVLGRSKVRRVFSSVVEEEAERLVYRVRGSGFLKHMVRNLVGTLLEAGKGNLCRAELLAMLEPGYPGKAGPTAPACGLFLISVEYPER